MSPSNVNTCARFVGLALVCLCACGGASADLAEYLAGHDASGGVASSSSGGASTDSASADDGSATDDGAAGGGDDAHSAAPPSLDGGSGEGSDAAPSDGAGDDGQGYDATMPDAASNTGDAGPIEAGGGTGSDGATGASRDASCGAFTATLDLLPSSCSSCLQAACGASISLCLGTGCDDCVAGVQVCETASCATECLADAGPPVDSTYPDAAAVDAASPCVQVAPCCYFYILSGPITLGDECNAAVQANDVATCSSVLSEAQAIGLCR